LDATYVPYTFTIFDQNNQILEERKGATVLPKNQTVGIFEGSIAASDGKIPRRAIFEIEPNITWQRNEKEKEQLVITHTPLLREDTTPRVEAIVRNDEIYDIENVELVLAIFDGSDNAVAASRTLIENVKSNESVSALFTWPRPFDLGTKVCEKPSDAILLLDRSGSMASISQDPAEPLTSAKEAAVSFVDQLNARDKVGVVSFASNASSPIEFPLSSDFDSAKEAVMNIGINSDGTQYTNIYEALRSALQELLSARSSESSSKVAILLTDGVANNPRDPAGRTEEDDIRYAENAARTEASNAKESGVSIYTIGLGNQINSSFLQNVASGVENYFFAPTANDLESIYKEISSDICKEVPARIEITYRIFGSSI
jgi:Mg-chelatase subunit ChlD